MPELSVHTRATRGSQRRAVCAIHVCIVKVKMSVQRQADKLLFGGLEKVMGLSLIHSITVLQNFSMWQLVSISLNNQITASWLLLVQLITVSSLFKEAKDKSIGLQHFHFKSAQHLFITLSKTYLISWLVEAEIMIWIRFKVKNEINALMYSHTYALTRSYTHNSHLMTKLHKQIVNKILNVPLDKKSYCAYCKNLRYASLCTNNLCTCGIK